MARTRQGPRASRCASLVALLVALLQAGPAGGSAEPFELLPQTRRSLAEIQDLWIDWLSQVGGGDGQAADRTVDAMTAKARAVGMESLPELAIAAAAQAIEFSRSGQLEAASGAVSAAEKLAPDGFETAWAARSVAWRQGAWLEAVGWWARAVKRLLFTHPHGRLVVANVVHWLLVVAVLAGLAFVAFEMSVRGSFLVADLTEFIGRSLPEPAAYALAVTLLLWPVFLPGGLLWLVLYWSVLLWGYGSRLEKLVLIVLWLFLGALPVVVSEHARRLDFALSTQVRAVKSAAEGRLYGALFTDLGGLREVLPDSVALGHLEADLHARLGQWEMARALYREVRAAEPENTAALSDLGACYFSEGDLDNASRYLEEAAARPDAPPEAYFNLSRTLSELYRFSESEAMLRRASQLDSDSVDRWITRSESNLAVMVGGGFERSREILDALRREWERAEAPDAMTNVWRRTLSLPLALVLVGPAIGVYLLARRRRRLPAEGGGWFSAGLERLRAVLLPGLMEAERQHWWRAAAVLVAVLALLALPFIREYGFSLATGLDIGSSAIKILPLVVLVLLLAVRFVRLERGSVGGQRGG